eukprot:CAMPEP_0168445072 /NCGR_PEP_ID=MMETSP0228-20121227/45379_1 /TAXON_ID=133427 /ORGANISM="Protoceratium reticulatum, Strain CCCM 535 (=CCMP 1889)" /LENGTH=243 /DNA_ID=CAMNT_0008459541 /DNA_START=96 /DNA_END=827 /DNA_ORIENTATION=+
MFEPQAGNWICSSSHASDSGPVDEEIIGDDGEVYKSHAGSDDKTGSFGRQRRADAPLPVGGAGGPQDSKETAKQRLQRLIRDFAHDAVGPGLEVEAQCRALAGVANATSSGSLEALLRMDRRLSRIELWAPDAREDDMQGKEPLLKVSLQQVTAIAKRAAAEGDEESSPESPSRDSATLSISRRSSSSATVPDLRITFDSSIARDRAYTCLRIFQMSVDQSQDTQSREAESNATGIESQTPSV